ncbi:MAG: ATP-binding cassette domain-containing protein [Chlamydiales bacterium]|nr:ATP-binding cassette domain-containing protein [Chlamydiales bacterium]
MRVDALKNVTLNVEKGDIFGIIGQSGAGKSTLIRCLATLEKPSSGAIFINGCDTVKMGSKVLRYCRRKIGMIFQHFNLLSSRTVAENIAYPLEVQGFTPDEIEARVNEMLKLVDLESKKDVSPANLSGGQKQRVGIARALATYPDVLLCDEATSALDPKTTRDILALLKKLNRDLHLTIVLITHEMDVVKQLCNKVAVVHQGKIVETGPFLEVFSNPQHPTTQEFLQHSTHELPTQLVKRVIPNGLLLHLSFKGKEASQPVISQMIKKYDVHVNILSGWVESLQDVFIGNLVLDITGPETAQKECLAFLSQHNVQYEVL